MPPKDSVALAKGISRAWQLSDLEQILMQKQARKSINKLHPTQAIPKLINYYQHIILSGK